MPTDKNVLPRSRHSDLPTILRLHAGCFCSDFQLDVAWSLGASEYVKRAARHPRRIERQVLGAFGLDGNDFHRQGKSAGQPSRSVFWLVLVAVRKSGIEDP